MKNLSIDLVEHHRSDIELSSDGYVTISVEVEFGLIPETPIYIEAQLLSLKNDVVVSISDSYPHEVMFEHPRVYLSDYFHAGSDQIPDTYAINFRYFTPEEKYEIDTPIPPEIARQSGAYLIHTPKKGLLSREKWVSGAASVDSIVVKNVAGEDDEIFVNVSSSKPVSTGFQLTCQSGGSTDYTIFKIFDKPQLTSDPLRIHLTGDLVVGITGFGTSDWAMTEPVAIAERTQADDRVSETSPLDNDQVAGGNVSYGGGNTRYYMVNTGGSGGELTIGRISREFVEHWSSADNDELMEILSEINSESDDVSGPTITENGNCPFYDIDDIEHTTAPYEDNEYEVDEVVPDVAAEGGYRFVRSVVKGEYNRLYGRERYSEEDDGSDEIVPILTFHTGEKGSFGRVIIETSGDFDPNKFSIGVMETDVGNFIDSYWYDGKLIAPDNDWDDSRTNFSSATVGYLALTDYGSRENYLPGSELIQELFEEMDREEYLEIESAQSKNPSTDKEEIQKSIQSSDGKSEWVLVKDKTEHQTTKELSMTLTRFENEAPDEDGDISIDLEFEIKNESDKDINLIKYDLVIEQDGIGTIGGQTRNTEDCLLDAGEVFNGSCWLRLNQHHMDKNSSEVTVKLYARVYEREFFKLGSIEVPAETNTLATLTKEIDSDLLEPSIIVGMVRRPDGDEDSKEDRLEFKASVTNKSDAYVEDLELRIVLMDRTGAEDDDTYDTVDTLGPHSGTFIEPSFWGKPKSKLKGATVDVFLKAHRLIGTQIISETRTLSS